MVSNCDVSILNFKLINSQKNEHALKNGVGRIKKKLP